MKGPVALVTGAARGLGLEIARRLQRDGYTIVLADVEEELVMASAAELAATGGALGLRIDVQDDESVAGVTATIEREYGRLDVLVNNAGVIHRSNTEELSTENWMREIDINLGGVMRCSRAAYPLLIASDNPSIVNLASVGSTFGLTLRAGYTASKTGVVGLTRELAAEWGPVGIRANSVAPGYMDAPMLHSGIANKVLDEELLLSRTPLGRFGLAEDVAAAVSFLVSRDAKFITGIMLPVDGGITIDGTFHRR